ncbi:hypothetical protein, partial [Leuconostoc mesenteroides]|uniref:hypothetical protein n=1 Tax=Leuconostoc mesenteroides TaxID=1245 RepID=UPI002362427A
AGSGSYSTLLLMSDATAAPPAANLFATEFAALRANAPALRAEDVAARRHRLGRLANWLMANREAIQQALFQDFKKPPE